MRLSARFSLVAAAGAIGLLMATPAHAAEFDIPLREDHKNTTAAGFNPQDCTGPFADKPANQDGWHFVLPMASGDHFISVTLEYSGGTVGPIDSIDPDNPSSGTGWSGYIDNAGTMDKHLYVFTTAGWTLLDGTATVEADDGDGEFNLSHTCPGIPNGNGTPPPPPGSPTPPPPPGTPTPTPPGTPTPTPPGTPTPSGPAKTGGGGSQGGISWFGIAALVTAAGSAGFLMLRRKRT